MTGAKEYDYTVSVSVGDGYTVKTYYFSSRTGNYSIEFLAGVIQGATDLRLVSPRVERQLTSANKCKRKPAKARSASAVR